MNREQIFRLIFLSFLFDIPIALAKNAGLYVLFFIQQGGAVCVLWPSLVRRVSLTTLLPGPMIAGFESAYELVVYMVSQESPTLRRTNGQLFLVQNHTC